MIGAMAGDSRPAVASWVDADTALSDLYRAHSRSLVRLSTLLLGDTTASEDVVQDAFVKMHGSWRRLRDPEKALAYLRACVVNGARSRHRHLKVARDKAPKPMPDAASAEHGGLAALDRGAVTAALKTLSTRQREAVVLRYYGQLTESEIATTMGVSNGAVKSYLHRGMAALEQKLEPLR